MNAERWATLETLLEQALALPIDEREAFLIQACGDDAELHQQLKAMLNLQTEASAFFDHLGGQAGVAAGQALDTLSPLPERIGPYRIERELGRGGMGTVYLAERDDGQFEQQVALKVVKRGMDTDDVLRRFRHERQILARLQHPNIARLYDGGMTDDDRPYFAMEYVDGEPITTYCTERHVPVMDRLRLFAAVGEAVQYAHRNLIVHRDLKPSNILVTETGKVKLLDFGIAKLLTGDTDDAQMLTRTGVQVMTPAYAAPEQLKGEAVTTATDVYALGVVLYELLTGQRPDRDRTRATRELHGDLDFICRKALRTEPEERYASVEAFVTDIRRHLDGLPVNARRGNLSYRARKFVWRNRIPVGMAAVMVILTISFGVLYTVQIAQERDRAQEEARKAEEVKNLLVGLFENADPENALGDTLTVYDLLDQGEERVQTELTSQAEIQAELLNVLGNLRRVLGDLDKAEPLLARALDLRRDLFGSEHRQVAQSLHDLGYLFQYTGDYHQADSLYRMALEQRQALLGEPHPDVAESLHGLAGLHYDLGQYEEAQGLYQRALDINLELSGPSNALVAHTQDRLAAVYQALGEYDRAEALFREALATRRTLFGELHPAVANSLYSMAYLLWEKGEFEESLAYYQETQALESRLWNPDHPDLAITLNNIGLVMRSMGRYEEGEQYYREALDLQLRHYDPDHPDVATTQHNLGTLLLDAGRPEAAEPLLRAALRTDQALYGDDSPYVGIDKYRLSQLLLDTDRLSEADTLLQQALSAFRGGYPEGHFRIGTALFGLGRLAYLESNLSEAESLFREALAIVRRAPENSVPEASELEALLGVVLADQGHLDEARSLLEDSYAKLQDRPGRWRRTAQLVSRYLDELGS